jgi:hypothetical protein
MKTAITIIAICLLTFTGTPQVIAQKKVIVQTNTLSEGLMVACEPEWNDYFNKDVCGKKKGYWDDIKDKLVIPLIYDEAREFKNGIAAVAVHNKWGFINHSGEVVIPLKYDYIGSFDYLFKGLLNVRLNGKKGYIDRTGREVIPIKYDYMNFEFVEGLMSVSLNKKKGFLDRNGKVAIPIMYDDVDDFSKDIKGLAKVRIGNSGGNDKYGYIDKA